MANGTLQQRAAEDGVEVGKVTQQAIALLRQLLMFHHQ
jgi:hypothetical protein